MSYKILDLSDKDEWNSYIEKLPADQQDIYFKPEYYSIYEANEEGKAKCFVFEDGNDTALYPFLMNSVNSLGYELNDEYCDIQGAYGYNGVISSSYSEHFISSFYTAFDSFCKSQNVIAEFTRFHPLLENYKFSSGNMMAIKDRKTVFLNLEPSIDEIWENSYSSINRNMIRKAMKNNIAVTIEASDETYLKFYELYSGTMSDINALPYYYFNKDYFKNFRDSLGENQVLLLAKLNGEVICGMLLMFYKQYAHYHLSGRVKEFSNLAPNNLILDYAIRYAQEQKCRCFHFGGGNTNSNTDTLFKFKSNFSGTHKDFYIGKKIHNREVYDNVVSQWQVKYESSYLKNKIKLLGYREKE